MLGPVVPDFGVRTDVQVGPGFLSDALTIDLNGDGLLDLVEGNFALASVTIALGNPDGTFTTLGSFTTLGAPWRIAEGDVDGNGLSDLAVTCLDDQGAYPTGLHVLLQGPLPGDFGGASLTLELPTRPLDIALAPLTGVAGDPGPDEIFVTDRQAGAVLRFRFDGAGLVANGTVDSTALGLGEPLSVTVADLGGDGLLDLVVGEVAVTGGAPDRVVAYPRDGADFLDPVMIMSPLVLPIVDLAGDVDGNTFDDVSIAQLGADHAFLLTGDGTGLSQFLSIDFEGTTSSLVFGDLNDDGLADVAGTVLEADTVQVRLATASLTWGDPIRYNVGSLPRALGVGRLAGDDVPDLLCASASDFSLLPGLGDGTFRGARGYPISEGPVFVQTADFDGDGDLDAVAITERQTAVCFLENDGTGALALVAEIPLVASLDENFGHLAVADMTGDGLPDVIASIYQANQVWILRNTGTVAGFAAPAPIDVYDVGPGPIGLGVGDLNDDQVPDLVIGVTGTGAIQCLTNSGDAEMQIDASLVIGDRPAVVRCADLDMDGDTDVVVNTGGNGTNERVVVFEGNGTGLLVEAFDGPLDTLGGSIDVADFDGDGLPDIVIAQPGISQTDVYVGLNLGGLAFDLSPVTVGENPGNVLAMDVDLDGNPDVVVASGTADLSWALGDGTGSFPVVEPGKGDLPVPNATVAAIAADMDGDGLQDLLMVSPLSPMIWIATNTSVPLPLD